MVGCGTCGGFTVKKNAPISTLLAHVFQQTSRPNIHETMKYLKLCKCMCYLLNSDSVTITYTISLFAAGFFPPRDTLF